MKVKAFMVHSLITWLLLLGLCAGLQARALATDPCEISSSMQHSEHHHDHESPCDPDHDKNCPQDHHNHGCFCHGMPLAVAHDQVIRLNASCQNLSRMRHECETAPDGPFLSEDKPPLI
jgi:hypothetical protein